MMLRRFFSPAIREAVAVRKQIKCLIEAQRDLLSPKAIVAVQEKINELNAAIAEGNKGRVRIKADELQFAAEKNITSYPHRVWRENVEVLLVAIAVATGIRTFFLLPNKIPTGSMQPTLYGVTSTPDFSGTVRLADDVMGKMPDDVRSQLQSEVNRSVQAQQDLVVPASILNGLPDDLREKLVSNIKDQLQGQKDLQIPGRWERFKQWFEGISYLHIVAQHGGTVEVGPLHKFLIFNICQTISIGGVRQTIWFPPYLGESDLQQRVGLFPGRVYRKGEDVVKMKVHAGDYLFVDRLTYNFRRPRRGEIVVFETKGIPEERRVNPPFWNIPANEIYIKRLVGLGGDTISLKKDYDLVGGPYISDVGKVTPIGHLIINGQPLSASTPHFENLYTFYGAERGTNVLVFHPNHYYGHAMIGALSPGQEFYIRPGHDFLMGDDTVDSLDSRYWGDLSNQYVIGKPFFVYWPITRRFGLDDD